MPRQYTSSRGPGEGVGRSNMAYPHKPIRLIQPFQLGSTTDDVAQAVASKLGEVLGQPIELEPTYGGVGGSLGPEIAAQGDRDGYTLAIGTIGNISLLPAIYPDYAIDPAEAFTPITMAVYMPDLLVAHHSLGVSTIEELIATAKAKPGNISYHGVNAGSIHRVEFLALMSATGIELNEADLDGGSPGAIDKVVEGGVDLLFTTAPRLIPHVKTGALSALATASPNRIPALTDTPTFSDLGLHDLDVGSWMGFFTTARTPPEIVSTLFDALSEAMADEGVARAIIDRGMDLQTSESPEAFGDFVTAETARLTALVADYEITL